MDAHSIEMGLQHESVTRNLPQEKTPWWKCSLKSFNTTQKSKEADTDQGFKKGGWKTIPFVIGNEVCEKLAMIGLNANLITYLTDQLHMSTVEGAVTLTNFQGANNITPLLGAYLADAHFGRYVMIIVGSLVYTIGIFLLTIDAKVTSLRPPKCDLKTDICKPATKSQKGFLYFSFLFFAMGAGAIKPCVAAFGADQFDPNDPKQKKQSFSFFNWYYFGLGLAVLLSITVIVYIQENIGWVWGFGIPAIAMLISLIVFVIGSPLYRHVNYNGSPFTRLAQVIVAAFRKRKCSLPLDPDMLNHCELIKQGTAKLKHTDQFRFLDKAAVKTAEDVGPDGKVLQWRLCSVQQVEELKCIIRTAPIWATGVIFQLAHSQQSTFTVRQTRTMNRHLGSHFQIPPASFHVFGVITLLAWVPLYDRVFMPVARKFTGIERGVTFLQRIGIGLFISIIAMVVAGFVEHNRRETAIHAGLMDHPKITVPYSAFWLVPQSMLLGLAEAFIAIGHYEFFYDQFPENIRSMASALFSSVAAIGSYMSSILVTVVHNTTAHDGHVDWLADNLNKGHLDYFYWLLAILFAINFVLFVFCAHWYRYKPVDYEAHTPADSCVDGNLALEECKL